jgi:hypothetical protein
MDNKLLNAFDYRDSERENTIVALRSEAISARTLVEQKWRTLDRFYSAFRATVKRWNDLSDDESELSAEMFGDYCFQLTDPYIQIESQIDPTIPEPMFFGRDNKNDGEKAKQREYVVKYLLDKNDLEGKNTQNERTFRKFGDSFAKVYYRNDIAYDDSDLGDICVDFIDKDEIFPDPTADSIESCEYIDYIYYIHRRKAQRLWGKEFKKRSIDITEIGTETKSITKLTDNTEDSTASAQHDVQITEHWYRDDEGDIALSMLIGDKEFKHVEKYWKNTGSQNKSYPFVHFYRFKENGQFWGVSELEVILPLCEIVNHILNTALANWDRMGNDSILAEENALKDGEEITNLPGETIWVKDGKINSIRRLGGLNSIQNIIETLQYFQNEIQRTLRNYESNMGKEPARVTTASGLQQLRSDAMQQGNIKDYDRMQAWKRLFVLLDWTALEFYNDDRHIFIGTPQMRKRAKFNNLAATAAPMADSNLDSLQGNIYFTFNSENVKQARNRRIVGIEDGINQVEQEYYYPGVDCKVKATNGIEKSKSFVIEVLQTVMGMQISPDNYKVAIKLIRELGIPQSEEIINEWLEVFEPEPIEGVPPEIQAQLNPTTLQMLRKNPVLLEKAKTLMAQQAPGNPVSQVNPAQMPR